jgi:hypothetical protein
VAAWQHAVDQAAVDGLDGYLAASRFAEEVVKAVGTVRDD